MINNVTLVGRLTKDIDLKYTSNGLAVAQFTLAVARDFANQNGEKETDFINCVMWRKSAETLANYAKKGSLIGVVGRIQTRSYDNQQGQRVYVTEVNAERFNFLEKKAENTQANNQPSFSNPQASSNQQNPLGGQTLTINADDLPF